MGEFRDAYREASEGAALRPSSRAPGWLYLVWIFVIPLQLIVGVLLSTDAWVAIQPNPHRPVGLWHGGHPAWIFVAAMVVGFMGGASGVRPWFLGAAAYIIPASLLILMMATWVSLPDLAVGGLGASTALVGAACGFWSIGRRLPRIQIGGDLCARCDYDLSGLTAGSRCPECGAAIEPNKRSEQA